MISSNLKRRILEKKKLFKIHQFWLLEVNFRPLDGTKSKIFDFFILSWATIDNLQKVFLELLRYSRNRSRHGYPYALYSVVHANNITNPFKEVTINLWFDQKANSSGSLAGMNKKSSLMKKLIRFYLIEWLIRWVIKLQNSASMGIQTRLNSQIQRLNKCFENLTFNQSMTGIPNVLMRFLKYW